MMHTVGGISTKFFASECLKMTVNGLNKHKEKTVGLTSAALSLKQVAVK